MSAAREREFCDAISFQNFRLIQTSQRTTGCPIITRPLRVFFLLNFGELEKRSGRSIGYGPTIETVRVPIDKIVDLIIEYCLIAGCLRSPLGADEQAHILDLQSVDQNRDVFAS